MIYKYRNFIITSLLLTAMGLFLFELSLLNRLPQQGVDIRMIEMAVAKLEHENKLLKEEILENESLRSVEMRSAELGFTDQVNYLKLK